MSIMNAVPNFISKHWYGAIADPNFGEYALLGMFEKFQDIFVNY